MKKFLLEITTGPVQITERELWPDGNAPDSPTVEDVEALLASAAPYRWSLASLISDWNLDDNMEVYVTDEGEVS